MGADSGLRRVTLQWRGSDAPRRSSFVSTAGLRFCLYRLGVPEDAEDAVQVTFLHAFRALDDGTVPRSESAWLRKIAENVCTTRHRSTFRRRRFEMTVPVDETLAAPEHDDVVLDFENALRELPPRQRRALLLREWQGLAYAEIASELDVSQSAVETLLFRARRSLRAAA